MTRPSLKPRLLAGNAAATGPDAGNPASISKSTSFNPWSLCCLPPLTSLGQKSDVRNDRGGRRLRLPVAWAMSVSTNGSSSCGSEAAPRLRPHRSRVRALLQKRTVGHVRSGSNQDLNAPRRNVPFAPNQRTSPAWRGTSDKCLNIGYREGTVARLFADPLLLRETNRAGSDAGRKFFMNGPKPPCPSPVSTRAHALTPRFFPAMGGDHGSQISDLHGPARRAGRNRAAGAKDQYRARHSSAARRHRRSPSCRACRRSNCRLNRCCSWCCRR